MNEHFLTIDTVLTENMSYDDYEFPEFLDSWALEDFQDILPPQGELQ